MVVFFFSPGTNRCRLASAIENDQRQLRHLYSACRGIPQVEPPDTRTSSLDASQPTAEALNIAMSRGASVQSEAINTNGWGSSGDSNSHNGWGTSLGDKHSSEENTNGWMDKQVKDDYSGWGSLDSKPVIEHQLTENVQSHDNNSPIVSLASCNSAFALSVPSAPPIPDEVLSEGPIYYPSINSSALDMPVPSMTEAGMSNSRNSGARDSSCAICWDASTEGACIPCGHMAGCMPCLNEIKVNKGVCPICLTKIDQVVRLYAV